MSLKIFGKIDPARLASTQLAEAQIHLLEHRAAAEHFQAMAAMYERRVARLQAEQRTREAALDTA